MNPAILRKLSGFRIWVPADRDSNNVTIVSKATHISAQACSTAFLLRGIHIFSPDAASVSFLHDVFFRLNKHTQYIFKTLKQDVWETVSKALSVSDIDT